MAALVNSPSAGWKSRQHEGALWFVCRRSRTDVFISSESFDVFVSFATERTF